MISQIFHIIQMKLWVNCFAVSGQRCVSGSWLLHLKVVIVKVVKQTLCVDFMSLIYNLFMSPYILFYSFQLMR